MPNPLELEILLKLLRAHDVLAYEHTAPSGERVIVQLAPRSADLPGGLEVQDLRGPGGWK